MGKGGRLSFGPLGFGFHFRTGPRGLLISDLVAVGVEMWRGDGVGTGPHIFKSFPTDSNVQPGLRATGLS